MAKIILALALVLALAGCDVEAQETPAAPQTSIEFAIKWCAERGYFRDSATASDEALLAELEHCLEETDPETGIRGQVHKWRRDRGLPVD